MDEIFWDTCDGWVTWLVMTMSRGCTAGCVTWLQWWMCHVTVGLAVEWLRSGTLKMLPISISNPSVSDWRTSRSRTSAGFSEITSTMSCKWFKRRLANSSRITVETQRGNSGRPSVATLLWLFYEMLSLWTSTVTVHCLHAYYLQQIMVNCMVDIRRY